MTFEQILTLVMAGIAALSLISSFTRGRKKDTVAETEAFITVKVLLDQLAGKVDAISRKLEETGMSMTSCDKDIALLKQRVDLIETRLDQHLNTHPPNAKAAE